MKNLITHELLINEEALNSKRLGALYGYLFAGNGVFIGGRRPGLSVLFPVSKCEIRGLLQVGETIFRFDYPKISQEVMENLLYHAQESAEEGLERLFHICFDGEVMRLYSPVQIQTAVSCKPVEDDAESTLHNAQIEIHSHHSMPAFFSKQDDRDETGFRIYGVIGRVLDKPEIRFRVGLHGYFYNIPAAWVCDLPDSIEDLNT